MRHLRLLRHFPSNNLNYLKNLMQIVQSDFCMTNLTKLAKSRIQLVKLVNFAIQIFAWRY